MHQTKQELIERNGLKCMFCGEEVPYENIEWHHIIPKHITKFFGLPQDDSYENGALLCKRCHKIVHIYEYWDVEYYRITQVILSHKKPR